MAGFYVSVELSVDGSGRVWLKWSVEIVRVPFR